MIIKPSNLQGQIKAIASKSYAHRALICASLADESSRIFFEKSSKDIDATIDCLKEMGAEIQRKDYGVRLSPIKKRERKVSLNPKESGSTLRFLLPLASALYDRTSFKAEGRLPDRPISELTDIMQKEGVEFTRTKLPFETKNIFNFSSCSIRADISSQYISGLLFAAVSFNHKSQINLTSKLESKAYVDMTIDVLKKFGADIKNIDNGFIVREKKLRAMDYKVEGDWSNAGFFLLAAALKNKITMTGLNKNSLQADMKIVDILKDFGADILFDEDKLEVSSNRKNNLNIDISQIPDMLPLLSVLAASVDSGKSVFYNAKRLRIKESDRLFTTCKMINDLGGRAVEKEDYLEVYATNGLRGGIVNSYNDHRIAMAASIASVICKENIEIINERAVEKSYPNFYEDFSALGGNFDS